MPVYPTWERGEEISCSQPSVWQAVYCGVREGRESSALSPQYDRQSTVGWERGGIFFPRPSVWQAVYCGVREGRNFLLSALSNTDLLKHGLPHFPWSNGLRSPNQFPTGVHTHVATIGWLEGNLCLWASYHSEDLSRLWRVIWVCVCVQTLVLHQAIHESTICHSKIWVVRLGVKLHRATSVIPTLARGLVNRCSHGRSDLEWIDTASVVNAAFP